ncbi:MAG: GNAT family N-acetyltransferase [Xanthomonadales bacterium]|nr:GNAT family N-acetyltransferase [Xanthomonadales bacterium]
MSADSSTGGDMQFAVRLAMDAGDLEAAARLRYEVLVEEMGKSYPRADAQRRLLADPLDPHADVLLAEDATGTVVGTIRSYAFGTRQDWTVHDSEYALREFAHLPRAVLGTCTHLAVHRLHRRFLVRDLLFRALYSLQLERGVRLCFTSCPRILVRLFEHYGFREYAATVQDELLGPVQRLVLALDDLAHLRRVQSPFLEIAQSRDVEPAVRPWLEDLVATRVPGART